MIENLGVLISKFEKRTESQNQPEMQCCQVGCSVTGFWKRNPRTREGAAPTGCAVADALRPAASDALFPPRGRRTVAVRHQGVDAQPVSLPSEPSHPHRPRENSGVQGEGRSPLSTDIQHIIYVAFRSPGDWAICSACLYCVQHTESSTTSCK